MQHLYRHFDKDGRLLYVGISLSAVQRLGQHRYGACWFDQITTVTIEQHPDRKAVEAAEREAIKREKPIFNVQRLSRRERKQRDRRIEAERLSQQRQYEKQMVEIMRPAVDYLALARAAVAELAGGAPSR
jgi:predicted GIY-YIG superfamily endonuclease